MTDLRGFPGVTGHLNPTRMLQRAIANGRLHHALLLAGADGIGKRALARGLACALLCEVEQGIGCGQCNACKRVLNATHTDFVGMHGSGKSQQLKRETMHDAILRLARAPHEASTHVTYFDPADRMTIDAANVLLKTLEEPGPGVYLVLIANNVQAVLPTLVSRCLHIPLAGLDRDDLRSVVQTQLGDEAVSTDDLEIALQLSEGSPGRALQLLRDPSLQATQRFISEMIPRVSSPRGLSAIFGGDHHPLWQAWQAIVDATPEPEEAPAQLEDASFVEQVRGAKSKSAKPRKKAAAKTSASKKPSAARQRLALQQMCQMWLLRLRVELRNSSDSADARRLLHAVNIVQELSRLGDQNINVRLLLEQQLWRLIPQQNA